MNKKTWLFFTVFAAVLYCAPIMAQDAVVISQELADIREDIKILQRRIYENSGDSDLSIKVGRLDEMVRSTSGRLDEMDYKIKQLEERINLINRDIDVRMKLLEGKKIEAGAVAPIADNSPKFSAPVAAEAPKAIVGDKIAGGDLSPIKMPTAAEIYQTGLEALKANDTTKAEASFNTILNKYPKDKLAGNAQYWLGETYYSKKEFDRAAVAFAKGYQGYKDSPKKSDSLLKLGMSMAAMGKKAEACGAYASLPIEFPKAEAAIKDKAKNEAKKLGCK